MVKRKKKTLCFPLTPSLQIRIKSIPPLPRLLRIAHLPRYKVSTHQPSQRAAKILPLRKATAPRYRGARLKREGMRAGEYEGYAACPGEDFGSVFLDDVG